MYRVIITIKHIKNISIDILFILCMARILKLVGLEGSFFLKKYPNTSPKPKNSLNRDISKELYYVFDYLLSP